MSLIGQLLRAICPALLVLLLACPPAKAISMDKSSTIRDQCEFSVGPDLVEVVAYMPDRSRDRFCADFPSTGRIIMTIDLIAARLRDLPIEVRVVKEPSGPLTEEDDLAPLTVAFMEPRVYPGGAVIVGHTFTESGNYAAFITVIESSGARRTTRFGFTVGGSLLFYAPAILGGVFLTGLVLAYWSYGAHRGERTGKNRKRLSRGG